MAKQGIVKVIRACVTLAFFILSSIANFIRHDGGRLNKNDGDDQGYKIGKIKVQVGVPEAYGICGSSYNCAGGGGECGAAYDCVGSGRDSSGSGTCGSAYNCAGGGGECGAAYDCAGR